MPIKRLVDVLDYDDLRVIRKDLMEGGPEMLNLVSKRIEEKERHHGTQCDTCMADIDPRSRHNYTLVFGPIDYRKKATFCAVDCLLYFLDKLKRSQCSMTKQQQMS